MIASALQKGGFVYAYDAKGKVLCSFSVPSGSSNGLMGYTSNSVTVRKGNNLYTYDPKGRLLHSKTA
jgi:hypothetical protein